MKCMAYKPILKYFIKFLNQYVQCVMRVLVTHTFFPLSYMFRSNSSRTEMPYMLGLSLFIEKTK